LELDLDRGEESGHLAPKSIEMDDVEDSDEWIKLATNILEEKTFNPMSRSWLHFQKKLECYESNCPLALLKASRAILHHSSKESSRESTKECRWW